MFVRVVAFLLLFSAYSLCSAQSSVQEKRICIDPGHGGTAATDKYHVGPNGEREEWINLRVALLLKDMLLKRGAVVFLTREADVKVDLASRARMARDSAADLFISIHHNATADSSVNMPIVYFHGALSENAAGARLARYTAVSFLKHLYNSPSPASAVSDYTIFPDKGAAVLRDTYGIPGILSEASFFTNADEERRLQTETHNRKEAAAFLDAIEKFFREPSMPIAEKQIPVKLPPFSVLQESDRMKPEALAWLDDFRRALELMQRQDSGSLHEAYDLFTRSARSFPDSWLARDCHLHRSAILTKLNKPAEAAFERTRAVEFYVPAEELRNTR